MSTAPRYGTIDMEYAGRLTTTDPHDDGPIWMVNLMKYREVAEYSDGRESSLSGREADDEYAPVEVLAEIGAEVVFFGDVDQQLLGDDTIWDRIGVVRYPTRRSFIAMQSRSDFRDKHAHKEAGMERTIVIGCQPMDSLVPPPGVVTTDWTDVEHPPTDEDGPVMALHVLRYHDAVSADRTPPHMEAYTSAAARVAARHGGSVARWFAVEGTILGDGRQWHQVRFNLFPSKRAFMAVVFDPERLEAQTNHRENAIADTYTMIVRPTIDRLSGSDRTLRP